MEHLHQYNQSKAILLKDYLAELTLGDVTNREGHAARVYFAGLFGDNFSRSQENSINAALNYGYGMLLSMVNRKIVSNGYMTQLGIFHDSADNPFNLGSDLMEPFRVLVDRIVRRDMPQQFESQDKRRMLELVNTEVYVENRSEYVPNAIKIYVRSILDALNSRDISKIKIFK